jgi:hypothetical protein
MSMGSGRRDARWCRNDMIKHEPGNAICKEKTDDIYQVQCISSIHLELYMYVNTQHIE